MQLSADRFFSADASAMRPSPIRALAKLINDPNVVSFAGGVPNPATFPAEVLVRCAETVIRQRRALSLQYGPTLGLAGLRALLADISAARGIRCSVEDVMVTTGSQQALSLIAQTLLDPGDVVLVELPTYVGATAAFHARRADLVGVAQDEEGLVPESLRETAAKLRRERRRIKLLYAIPNFQNPSGRLMAQRRRSEMLSVAAEHDFLIVEDDPYGELVFSDGIDTTPAKAADDAGRVIYLSSFSKTLAPGLRCGWIVAPPVLVRMFERAKEAADLCSGMLDQSIVEELCRSGELPAQIGRVRDFYRQRRDTLMAALTEHFAGKAAWTEAAGGLFTWAELADGRDTGAWLERAVRAGVAYVPGGPFFVDGSGANTMRLTFAKETDVRMREGIARLAQLFFGQEQ